MKRIALYLCIICTICACTNGGTSSSSATISTNIPTYHPGATTEIIVTNTSPTDSIINPKVNLAAWLESIAIDKNLILNGSIAPGESYTFSFKLDDTESISLASRANYQFLVTNPTYGEIQISADNLNPPLNPELNVIVSQDPLSLTLWEDIIINADLWSDQPEIMSAGYGFEGIEGVFEGESYVIAAGGAWEIVTTSNPPYTALTSAKTPYDVSIAWGYPTYLADAIPVVFSWPVLPSTVDRVDFAITLNTGEIVTPYVASISPNLEYNERSCVVIFGEFGNRLAPGTPGAIYPTKVSIVKKLKLLGPNGLVSAVGLTKDSTNAYIANGGPTLVAAKLSKMSIIGEGVGEHNAFTADYPNNGVAYYGESNAQYRLRIYTTGGFSSDGVAGTQPIDFQKFFQLQVTDQDGTVTWLTTPNYTYSFTQGNIEIVGLADLGVAGESLNDAYTEDSDNYIDIVLKGDESAMRLITGVKIPAANGYLPFYNPGGPGNNPTPGVTYTSPGPSQIQSVMMAIDDPKTVTYYGS
ncbi:MAG: hypothetical protein KBD37_02900 [Burkholderiales bacterium]|nr:hypothetical protein [Burkholderiales bacterium]